MDTYRCQKRKNFFPGRRPWAQMQAVSQSGILESVQESSWAIIPDHNPWETNVASVPASEFRARHARRPCKKRKKSSGTILGALVEEGGGDAVDPATEALEAAMEGLRGGRRGIPVVVDLVDEDGRRRADAPIKNTLGRCTRGGDGSSSSSL